MKPMPNGEVPEELAKGIYQSVYVTVFFSFFPPLIPDFSIFFMVYSIVIILATLIWRQQGIRNKWHLNQKWRIVSTIVHGDLIAINCGIILWRSTNNDMMTGILELLFFLFAAMIGHIFREVISQEIRYPTTKLGKILVAIGVTGAGQAALLAYSFAHFTTLNTALLIAYILCLILVVIFHSFWIFMQKPNWMPKMPGEKNESPEK